MPNEQYMDIADDLYSEMRLLIEGAITLFEDEASFAFNDIGSALYMLRDHIKQLQDKHHRQSMNSIAPPPCVVIDSSVPNDHM